MGAYTRGDRAAVAEDYARVLDLPRVRDARAGTLSGGEQQMLAMARALMARPKLICMDEPTMGLSPLYVDKVLELIDAINRQGVTVFMVEQNASLALEIAHYGYVLQTGRVVLREGAARRRACARCVSRRGGGGGVAGGATGQNGEARRIVR